MNNKENKKEEKTEEARPKINVKYTEQTIREMEEMSAKEMESTIKNMINSREWIAILKYNGFRMLSLDAILRTTNPYKDPNVISQTQGAMAGLCDLETYIFMLNKPKENISEEEEQTGVRSEGLIIGND